MISAFWGVAYQVDSVKLSTKIDKLVLRLSCTFQILSLKLYNIGNIQRVMTVH